MLTALTKLVDIAARSLFVLLALYALPIRSAGQFGLALTLIGFFAFAASFERYPDLQRRMVGASEEGCDRLIISAWRMYFANYAGCVPILLALLIGWVDLPATWALAYVVIAIGEHVAGEVYRIALIAPRHRAMLLVTVAKNLLLLAAVASILVVAPERFSLEWLIFIWSGLSLASIVAVASTFTRTWIFPSVARASGAGLSVWHQLKASRTHFMIGLVAVALLQSDRLIVGSLTSLEESGAYFRHVLLATFAYQVFNVASYGRVAARVYHHVKSGQPGAARQVVYHELAWLTPGAVAIVALFYLLSSVSLPVEALNDVNPHYLAGLTAAYWVRACADFNALLLNGAYSERSVFIAQFATLLATVPLNLALTYLIGIPGTVMTFAMAACLYYLISRAYTKSNPSLTGSLST